MLSSVLSLLGDGATHIGVATDHVIESFRNDLWPGYKDGSGIDPVLRSQFIPLEEALVALGVLVWPMVDLEADDALASAAAVAGDDGSVEQVVICTPDVYKRQPSAWPPRVHASPSSPAGATPSTTR